jgi:hypothetical protein
LSTLLNTLKECSPSADAAESVLSKNLKRFGILLYHVLNDGIFTYQAYTPFCIHVHNLDKQIVFWLQIYYNPSEVEMPGDRLPRLGAKLSLESRIRSLKSSFGSFDGHFYQVAALSGRDSAPAFGSDNLIDSQFLGQLVLKRVRHNSTPSRHGPASF